MLALSPAVEVAIIGAPAALITSIGTIWLISRRAVDTTKAYISPAGGLSLPLGSEPPPAVGRVPAEWTDPNAARSNGYRYVTHHELKEIVADIKSEMTASENRQNAKLDLIVTLLKDR